MVDKQTQNEGSNEGNNEQEVKLGLDINSDNKEKNKRKTIAILSFAGVFMFAFAFALVPLYSLICDVTGINNVFEGNRVKIESQADLKMKLQMDEKRRVNVEFTATINKGTEVEFYPTNGKMNIKPGEYVNTSFMVKNLTNEPMETRSVVSITPWQTTKFVKKVECFCFSNQTLEPNEEVEMGLVFYIDPEMPLRYKTVTLGYTIVDLGVKKKTKLDKQAKLN